jgi:hypothetical protein
VPLHPDAAAAAVISVGQEYLTGHHAGEHQPNNSVGRQERDRLMADSQAADLAQACWSVLPHHPAVQQQRSALEAVRELQLCGLDISMAEYEQVTQHAWRDCRVSGVSGFSTVHTQRVQKG